MALPPEMNLLSVPAVRSRRAAPPSLATTAWRAASCAPLTVLSAVTRTWLALTSTPHEVPGVEPVRSSVAVTLARSAALRVTSLATPPAAVTVRAAAASVTVTVVRPAAARSDPAGRLPRLGARVDNGAGSPPAVDDAECAGPARTAVTATAAAAAVDAHVTR